MYVCLHLSTSTNANRLKWTACLALFAVLTSVIGAGLQGSYYTFVNDIEVCVDSSLKCYGACDTSYKTFATNCAQSSKRLHLYLHTCIHTCIHNRKQIYIHIHTHRYMITKIYTYIQQLYDFSILKYYTVVHTNAIQTSVSLIPFYSIDIHTYIHA